jgi:hypothetical protein
MKNEIVIDMEKGIASIFANNRKDKFAIINYDEGLVKEIQKHTWTYYKDTAYFRSGAEDYYLHQFVMDYYYYGADERKKLYKE